jgi:hypothetical protein
MDTTFSISIGTVNAAVGSWQWFREYILWILKKCDCLNQVLTTGYRCNLFRPGCYYQAEVSENKNSPVTKDKIKLFILRKNLAIPGGKIKIRDPCRYINILFARIWNPYARVWNPYARVWNPYARVWNPYARVWSPYAGIWNSYRKGRNSFIIAGRTYGCIK